MHYTLTMDVPKEFYHEAHRPSHFLNFAGMEDVSLNDVDHDNAFL
jgi:pre-mRNA-processing factor 8